MPRARAKGAALSRIDLDTLKAGGTTEGVVVEDTLKGILEAFNQYIPGIIETLGLSAQPTVGPDGVRVSGDVDAAKKSLDFLAKALTGATKDTTGRDMLAQLAALRAAPGSDEDDE